jgi:hypothetical protein
VGAEKYDAARHHRAEIGITLKFNVAGPRGNVEDVIVDTTVLTQTSSCSVVDAVNAAGIEKEMIVRYTFCANHFLRSPFDNDVNIIISNTSFVNS